jgi:hypothetical protein
VPLQGHGDGDTRRPRSSERRGGDVAVGVRKRDDEAEPSWRLHFGELPERPDLGDLGPTEAAEERTSDAQVEIGGYRRRRGCSG